MIIDDYEQIKEIVQLIAVAQDLIVLQRMTSFSTGAERRASRNSLRVLDLVRAKVMTLPISKHKPDGGS